MNQLDKQYQELLLDIMHNGVHKETRNGKTISRFGKQIRHKMSEGFPLLTTKKMYWKGIVTELLWFLRGDTNIKYLVDNDCHIWDGDAYKNYLNETQHEAAYTKEEFINLIKTDHDWAKVWADLGPIYGSQWRHWGDTELDQIAILINDLKKNPDSRRLMVTAWNPEDLHSMVLPPCHYGFQVYTRELSAKERTALGSNGSTRLYDSIKEGNYETIDVDIEMHKVCDEAGVPKRAISLMWNQRSVDTFLGLPFNIASYGLLLEILAKMTNMIPDELIGNLGDVHLYEEHTSQVAEQITREPYRLPKLYINDEFWATVDDVKDFNVSIEILSMLIEDFQIEDYESHPSIKASLIN